MEEYGAVKIKLDAILKEQKLSKRQVKLKAGMQSTQFNNYCKNKVSRLDKHVLGRLCTALNCQISDLLEFVPFFSEDKQPPVL